MYDFVNKRVLITGGTRGIGFAAAKAFADAGAKVAITGRHTETLSEAAEKLGGALYLCWDIGDITVLPDKFDEAVGMLGGLDILVNNAGVLALHNYSFKTATPEDWDHVMNINVRGPYFMCQKAIAYMTERGVHGHIVNVCSNMGFRMICDAPYGISKWAVRGMTLGIGRTAAREGIIVNAVSPGPVTTDMMGWKEGMENHFPHIPTERYSTPEEVAETILFLASSETIVGQSVVADGGELLY